MSGSLGGPETETSGLLLAVRMLRNMLSLDLAGDVGSKTRIMPESWWDAQWVKVEDMGLDP